MDLFKSPRFIGILVIGLLQALVLFNIIDNTHAQGLILIIQGIIAAAITVRTVDRNGDKKVESAKIMSDITPVDATTDSPN